MTTILALDLGSTTFKAAAFSERLALVAQAESTIAYRHETAGAVEIAPEEIERALACVVKRCLAALGGDTPAAVAVTSQAQTFSVTDAAGKPKRPFVSWMDSRAREIAIQIGRDETLAPFGAHASFGAPLPGLALCVLAHLRTEDSLLLEPGDQIAFLPTYVMARLTGLTAVDDNLAAMTGLYSLELGDWWPRALERCGLGRDRLPALVGVGAAVGLTTENGGVGGLPGGIPVIAAGNDQTAGAYGCLIHLDGSLLVTLGTAQVAYTVADTLPPPDPALFRGPYPGGRSYRAAVDDGGGSLVSWASSVLARCAGPEDFFRLAGCAPPGSRGVLFAPGRWEGITPAHGPAELARSLLEYLVAVTAGVVRRVEPEPGRRRVLVAGGGSRQQLWVDLLSAALGVPLVRTEADPLLGAARLGLEALAGGPADP